MDALNLSNMDNDLTLPILEISCQFVTYFPADVFNLDPDSSLWLCMLTRITS
jgi:hypothetical protein